MAVGSICPVCNRPITDYPYTIRNGKVYHDACFRTLPPPRSTVVSTIARDLVDEITKTEALRHLSKVKAKHSKEIEEHGITDEEIIECAKRLLARR